MLKVAVVVLADTQSPGDFGRVVNALTTAKELKQSGDDVRIVFDGAGGKWVPELAKSGHKYHALYESVREAVDGVCSYCAAAFGVKEAVKSAGVKLLEDFEDHPSLRSLMQDGYQIVTF